MPVDSYAFLPRAFRPLYEAAPTFDHAPAWSDFTVPLERARIGLLSSAGIFLSASQVPFDTERERREPTWGDPTMRLIPSHVEQGELDATHLHINTTDILRDVNVALPLRRLEELVADGSIGSSASDHYSVMGFQEDGADVWRTETGPEIAAHCLAAEIDALILAPA